MSEDSVEVPKQGDRAYHLRHYEGQLWGQTRRGNRHSGSQGDSREVWRREREAAWFLKNRTYVDDFTGGAKDTEAAKQVSQDMEDIL
jgi:hypothetical protein